MIGMFTDNVFIAGSGMPAAPEPAHEQPPAEPVHGVFCINDDVILIFEWMHYMSDPCHMRCNSDPPVSASTELQEFRNPPPYKLDKVAKAVTYFMALSLVAGYRMVLHNAKPKGDIALGSVALRCPLFGKETQGDARTKGHLDCPFKIFISLQPGNSLQPVKVDLQRFFHHLYVHYCISDHRASSLYFWSFMTSLCISDLS